MTSPPVDPRGPPAELPRLALLICSGAGQASSPSVFRATSMRGEGGRPQQRPPGRVIRRALLRLSAPATRGSGTSQGVGPRFPMGPTIESLGSRTQTTPASGYRAGALAGVVVSIPSGKPSTAWPRSESRRPIGQYRRRGRLPNLKSLHPAAVHPMPRRRCGPRHFRSHSCADRSLPCDGGSGTWHASGTRSMPVAATMPW